MSGGSGSSGSGSAPQGYAWNVKRTAQLSYQLDEQRFEDNGSRHGSSRTYALALAGDGKVSVQMNGQAVGTFEMDVTGAIRRPDGAVPDPTLDLLAVAPDAGKVDASGGWNRVMPSDADAAAVPNAVVVQSKLTATRAGGTDAAPRFTFELATRVPQRAPTEKAIAALTKAPADKVTNVAHALDAWLPLGHGDFTFDVTDGSLRELHYVSVDWLTDIPNVAAVDGTTPRTEITLKRQ